MLNDRLPGSDGHRHRCMKRSTASPPTLTGCCPTIRHPISGSASDGMAAPGLEIPWSGGSRTSPQRQYRGGGTSIEELMGSGRSARQRVLGIVGARGCCSASFISRSYRRAGPSPRSGQ